MSFRSRWIWISLAVMAAHFRFLPVVQAFDWPPQLGRYDGGDMPHGMSVDCVLQKFSACSGWIWIFNDDEGAVWGTEYNTQDCPGSCASSSSVREIYLYTICTSSPAHFGGVGITGVDENYCRTASLYQSGPVTIVNCTAGNHWTTIETPPIPVDGRFAVTVTWGPRVNGASNPQFALDEEFADFRCEDGVFGFPGCATSQASCDDYLWQPQWTFIFVTDVDHDGTLDDVCARYGAAYPIDVPIPPGYSYWANNMLMGVGLECTGPTAVEPGSWGHVKALFR